MANIAVFCGASEKAEPEAHEFIDILAREMVHRGHSLVYGGVPLGAMRWLAHCVNHYNKSRKDSEKVKVTGVVPSHLEHLAEKGQNTIFVKNSGQAVEEIERISDAFVALGGGIGTTREIFHVMEMKQLGIHNKPIVILDPRGYYDNLRRHLVGVVKNGFAHPETLGIVEYENTVKGALNYIETYTPSAVPDAVQFARGKRAE